MNMNDGCLILRFCFKCLYSILINLLSCLRKLFISIELNLHIFCFCMKDDFTTVFNGH
jgi:hypothetical protein